LDPLLAASPVARYSLATALRGSGAIAPTNWEIPMRQFPFLACLVLGGFVGFAPAQQREVIPHAQDRPPGPPLSPAEAICKMTVPPGFQVELVAGEPDIVNPVAMTIDERGRFWITESLEYPRKAAGKGRDRIKILEDTDGDGRADKFTVFADGLNIPSGIAVGHGGVWVGNAPDILFLQDTDGDDRADKSEVVVTGFGRHDTHELPNSFTWGPDGFLYGLNGVFNPSRVEQDGRRYDFTCALFRIDPRTRRFELFCEGTSNPWGVAFDHEGSAFVSACVIDHLWHLVETGYYHRQGGPYPPFTWKIESIVEHKHQKAAYCGIHWFDSDAYPEQYRERLYMGNIHGNCINVDRLERREASYLGHGEPDFLSANDAWFMPVVQKTGPDGCLYILDWYDRYHCYQDANRDPAGIDRLKGRLYRVRYQNTPRAPKFDLAKETDDQLIERLASPNIYFRDTAQRLLVERNRPETRQKLERLVLDTPASRESQALRLGPRDKQRMHALWVLVGCNKLSVEFHRQLLEHPAPRIRAWGVRAAGNTRQIDDALRDRVLGLVEDPSPDVQLQAVIAAAKLAADPMLVYYAALCAPRDPVLTPRIVWQNLHPRLGDDRLAGHFIGLAGGADLRRSPQLAALFPRVLDRLLAAPDVEPSRIVFLLDALLQADATDVARECLATIAARSQSGELTGRRLDQLRKAMPQVLHERLLKQQGGPLYVPAALLAATWKDPEGYEAARRVIHSTQYPDELRIQALDALVAARDPDLARSLRAALADPQFGSPSLRGRVLASLGRLDGPAVSDLVLAQYDRMEPELQPKAVELLTQRPVWAKALLEAIGQKKLPDAALNLNQVRRLLASKDADLVKLVRQRWGTLREDRNPQREQVIADTRALLRSSPGDPHRGVAVFQKVCAQCHKIYGEGQDVGPDITANGRGSFEQLLSNVLDPSLVIGAAYQATIVATRDGRVLTGLVVEDSPQRLLLKVQGGKVETLATADIEERKQSQLSMMPEDLEKQVTPQDLSDLFAYLMLDKPPTDRTARRLAVPRVLPPREVTDPAQFGELLAQFAPGWSISAVGEGGLAIVAEHRGRPGVLRTHPVAQKKPCVLRRTVDIPSGKKARLVADVSHHAQGDWELQIRANGRTLHESLVGPMTTLGGWAEITIDLTPFAGQRVNLELLNQPNNWSWEFGFWGRIELVVE
jgi:putative membrane-bound dehydrogenase-like protein